MLSTLHGMTSGVVRRNVDARIISYAMAVLRDSQEQSEVIPQIRSVFQGCAAASLQAASGMVALAMACKSASQTPAVLDKFDNTQEKDRFRTLLASLSASIDAAWVGELKELFEVLVVLAVETSPDEEARFRTWAQGVFLDTRELAMEDPSEVQADVEIEDEVPAKRKRIRKPRSSKDCYEAERFENLVTKAVAMGIQRTSALIAGGQVLIMGECGAGPTKQLIKLRGSINEAHLLCARVNEEIRKLQVAEPFPT